MLIRIKYIGFMQGKGFEPQITGENMRFLLLMIDK